MDSARCGALVTGLFAVMAAGQTGCAAFSNYQSARTLPVGGTSVTGAVSNYDYNEEDGSASATAFEVMASHGLAESFELGGKLARFSEQGVDSYNLLVAPKIGLIPDTLAITAPTGIILVDADDFQEDLEHVWLTMPGVVYTAVLHPMFDLNLAGKILLMFDKDFDENNAAIATNVGLRFKPPEMPWSVTPELGLMVDNDSGSGSDSTPYVIQAGLAFSYEFGTSAGQPQ